MKKKILKIRDLNRYNLDVWGFFIWKNKYNKNLKSYLFSFEILLRRVYYSYFFILRKNFILFSQIKRHFFFVPKPYVRFVKNRRKKKWRKKKKWGILRIKRQKLLKLKLSKMRVTKGRVSTKFWSSFKKRFLGLSKGIKEISTYRKSGSGVDTYFKPIDLIFWSRISINKTSFYLGKRLFLLKKLRITSKKSFSPNRRLIARIRRTPFWVLAKASEKKFLYFYGFFKKNIFNRFLKNLNIRKKERFLVFYLEFILINFLFKLGFFSSTWDILKKIKLGWFCVNGKPIMNPYFCLKIFDNVSISDKFRIFFFEIILVLIKEKRLFLNLPPYIEVNYRLLIFSLWRLPKSSEFKSYYQFPFKKKLGF